LNILRKVFDYEMLYKMSKIITKNLNKVIDVNYYPVPETETSNKRHRPIGIGVQGLADVFALLKYPFDSDEAKQINIRIFETIYYGALEMSMEISKKREQLFQRYLELNNSSRNMLEETEYNKLYKILKPIPEELRKTTFLGTYSSYIGSPISNGQLQFDLWGVKPPEDMVSKWDNLKIEISKYGIRNSLLIAPMPTASTSQILGNNECIEPFTSNLYLRRVLAGEFVVINKYLIKDLIDLNIWCKEIKDRIILNDGSISSIDNIPKSLKQVYKTVWELSQKKLIDMSVDRGAYICQSQSLNLFVADPNFEKLSSMHFYSWGKGLKTGIYYLRTKPKVKAQQFTIDPNLQNDVCESCSG
jgi:ribonucleoside-diphosphate reductase alpha chain